MKQMFLKSCLFLFMIILPFGYLNYRYKNTNYYKQLNGLGKFRNIPQDIQILNLGNSHEEAGIIYLNNTNKRGYNLALSSQPFEYDYYILDSYASCLADGAVVIIPISYFDWYYNYEEIYMSEISTYNERYYSILDKEHIMNYELKKDILYNKLALLTAGKNMGYIFEDVSWTDQSVNNVKVTNIDIVADYKYNSWLNEVMAIEGQEREECKKKNIYYLKRMVDYCYNNGYKPVLVTLPMTGELLSLFSEEFKTDFYQNCNKVLEDYPDLVYLDYSSKENISENLNYFRDADHLNTDGANVFSRQLFKDLENMGILLFR